MKSKITLEQVVTTIVSIVNVVLGFFYLKGFFYVGPFLGALSALNLVLMFGKYIMNRLKCSTFVRTWEKMREEDSTRKKSSKTTSTTLSHEEWQLKCETLKKKMKKAGDEKQVKDLLAMKAKYDELIASEPKEDDAEAIISQVLDSIK